MVAPLAASLSGPGTVVSGPRLAPVLVTWDLTQVEPSHDVLAQSKRVPAGSVYLERFGAELRPAAGEGMSVMPWPAVEVP